LRDTYLNWDTLTPQQRLNRCFTVEPYIQEQNPAFDCNIEAHRTQLRDRLQVLIENGWELLRNGVQNGNVFLNKTHITIQYNNPTHLETFQIGNSTLIVEYQEADFVSYSDDDITINTTLYKFVDGDYNNTLNDLFVSGDFKFGANDTSSNETTLNNYTYVFSSNGEFKEGERSFLYYVSHGEYRRELSLYDVCSYKDIYNQSDDLIFSYNPSCSFDLDVNELSVQFQSNSLIDPEIIIEIVEAQHLNETRGFISDIYDDVKALDGNWSETIPADHYVRVVFEKNLTSANDITIYPRIINGTPSIKVYEKDESELITEFTEVLNDTYNKRFLTSLSGEQDTFDLLITGGGVQFDHIIDPNNAEWFEDCDVLDEWTLDPVGGWAPKSGQCQSTSAESDNMTRETDLSTRTSANITFYWENVKLDTGEWLYFYAGNSTSTVDRLFSVQGNGGTQTGTQTVSLDAYLSSTSTVIFNCAGPDGGESCELDNINLTSTSPEAMTYGANSSVPLAIDSSIDESRGFLRTPFQPINPDTSPDNLGVFFKNLFQPINLNSIGIKFQDFSVSVSDFFTADSTISYIFGTLANIFQSLSIAAAVTKLGLFTKLIAQIISIFAPTEAQGTPTTGLNISFIPPSPANGSTIDSDSIYLNISSSDAGNEHYVTTDLNRDLILWMTFDNLDGSGNPNDISTWGNDGTLQGAVINTSSGYFGNGTSTDGGGGNHVDIPDDPSLTFEPNWSLAYWERMDSFNNADQNDVIGRFDGAASRQFLLGHQPSGEYMYFLGDATCAANLQSNQEIYGTNYSLGNWVHVVWVFDTSVGTVDLYLDGEFANNSTYGGDDFCLDPGASLEIGRRAISNDEYFDGAVDELMIWNRLLNNTEVAALYNANTAQYYYNYTQLDYGSYNWSAHVVGRDDANNWEVNSTSLSVLLALDTSPKISYVPPTPANDSSIDQTSIPVNFTVADENETFSFIDFNRDLHLYFSMDELNSTDDPTDLSTYSYNGSAIGNKIVNDTNGSYGQSYTFDSEDDYIQTDYWINNSDEISFSVWAMPTVAPTDQSYLHILWAGDTAGNGGGNEAEFQLSFGCPTGGGCSSQSIQLFWQDVANDYNKLRMDSEGSGNYTQGVWRHIAGTITGIQTGTPYGRLYVNGLYADEMNGTDALKLAGWDVGLRIGAPGLLSATREMNGSIDEVIFWEREITEDEVWDIYSNTAGKYYNYTGLSYGNYNFTAYARDRDGEYDTETRTVTLAAEVAGDTYGRNATDQLTITTAYDDRLLYQRLIDQLINLVDTFANLGNFFKNIFQAINIEDRIVRIKLIITSVSDGINIEDSITTLVSQVRSINQRITLDNVVDVTTNLLRDIFQAINIDSAIDRTAVLFREVFISLNIQDAVNTVTGSIANIFQGISITAIQDQFSDFTRQIAQQINLNTAIDVLSNFFRNIFQQILIFDDLDTQYEDIGNIYTRLVDDFFSIDSTVERTFGGVRDIFQSIGINSIVDIINNLFRNLFQLITIEGIVEREASITKTADDRIDIEDSTERRVGAQRRADQPIFINSVIDLLSSFFKNLFQLIGINTDSDRTGLFSREVSDRINITDSIDTTFTDVGNVHVRDVFDGLNIEDMTERFYASFRRVAQGLNVEAIVERVANFFRAIFQRIDIFGVTDTTYVESLQTYGRNSTQPITIDDSVTAIGGFMRDSPQRITITAVVDRTSYFAREIYQRITITADIDVFASRFVDIFQAININSVVDRFQTFTREISQRIRIFSSVSRTPSCVYNYACEAFPIVGTISQGNNISLTNEGGDYLNITETAGAPAYNLEWNISWYDDTLNGIEVSAWYEGNVAHDVDIDLYNHTSGAWDFKIDIIEGSTWENWNFTFGNLVDYQHPTDDTITGRLIHTSPGNVNHRLSVDFIKVAQIGPPPVPALGNVTYVRPHTDDFVYVQLNNTMDFRDL
jgi:hypothetical protein